MHVHEASLDIGARLCLIEPSISKLKLLALSYSLHNAIRNDSGCVKDGMICSPRIVHYRAAGLVRSVRQFVDGVF